MIANLEKGLDLFHVDFKTRVYVFLQWLYVHILRVYEVQRNDDITLQKCTEPSHFLKQTQEYVFI